MRRRKQKACGMGQRAWDREYGTESLGQRAWDREIFVCFLQNTFNQ